MRYCGIRQLHKLWFVPVLMVLWLVFGVLNVSAEQPKGSVELHLPPVDGVEMTLYPVAERQGDSFVCSGTFVDCGIAIPKLEDAVAVQNAAEQLTAYAGAQKITGVTLPLDEGGW